MGRRRRGLAARAGLIGVLGIVAGSAVPSAAWATVSDRSGAHIATPTTPCTSVTYSLSISSTSSASATLSVTGQIDFAHAAATAALTFPSTFPITALAGVTEDVVLVGGTVYLSVPPSLQGFVGGASWVYVALPSSINAAVDTLGSTLASWCGNAQSLVAVLGGRRVSVVPLGSTSLGGVTVSGKALTARASRLTKLDKVARRVDRYLPAVGGRTHVTFDTWTNSQGQLVQLSANLGSFDISLSLSDVDQPVSISAPVGAVPLPAAALGLLGGFFST